MYTRSISICIVDLGKINKWISRFPGWGLGWWGLLLWVIVCNLGFLQLEDAVGFWWGLVSYLDQKRKEFFPFSKVKFNISFNVWLVFGKYLKGLPLCSKGHGILCTQSSCKIMGWNLCISNFLRTSRELVKARTFTCIITKSSLRSALFAVGGPCDYRNGNAAKNPLTKQWFMWSWEWSMLSTLLLSRCWAVNPAVHSVIVYPHEFNFCYTIKLM